MPNKVALEQIALSNTDVVISTDNKLFVGGTRQADSINIASVDTRISLEESTETAKVGSLDTRVGAEEDNRSSDVASIDTRVSLEESTEAAKVGSLDTRVGAEEDNRSTDVASIDTRVSLEESTEAAKVASIDTRLGLEEKTTQVATLSLNSGDESVEINFVSDLGMTAFTSTPAVAGMMRNSDASASIIIPMLVGDVETTGCKFVFSDNLVGNNYKMDIIVTD